MSVQVTIARLLSIETIQTHPFYTSNILMALLYNCHVNSSHDI